ncbi:MAG TPA: hypothetical protein VGP93_01720, partial [Polyangiaceae bacterium]|nr:hypothetical protein [Polyangiaceae bacterium]
MNHAFWRSSVCSIGLGLCALGCGSASPDGASGGSGASTGSAGKGVTAGGSTAAGGSSAGSSGAAGTTSAAGGSGASAGSAGNAASGGSAGAGASGGSAGGGTIDLDNPGVWVDITPPAAKPWADGSSFYYGFGWIDGAKADAPGTLYVGLDHNHDQDAGVWKTTDAGASWTLTNAGPSDGLKACAQPIVVDPTDSNIVYAGSIKSSAGLFKSTDGGTSWGSDDILPTDVEHDIYFLSLDPENHEHLLLTFHSAGANWASSGNAGVLETTNGGTSWNAIPA